jgi:hypothetical protein
MFDLEKADLRDRPHRSSKDIGPTGSPHNTNLYNQKKSSLKWQKTLMIPFDSSHDQRPPSHAVSAQTPHETHFVLRYRHNSSALEESVS